MSTGLSPEKQSAWLVCGDQVLASLEIARTRKDRGMGLIGRTSLHGAFMIRPCKGVHTFGVKFPIDVVFCNNSMEIIDQISMKPNRFGLLRLRSACVIESQAGSVEKWGIRVGDVLEVRQ